jgi:hypothetical protein
VTRTSRRGVICGEPDGVSPPQLSARDIRTRRMSGVSLEELVRAGGPKGVFSWVRPAYFVRPKGRRCTHCGEVLPFSAFRPNLKLSSGWSSWCRSCSAEATRAWRERNRDRLNTARRTRPARLRLSTGWSSWCRKCCSEATRAWRERNRERLNAARRTRPARLTCVECGEEFEGRKDRLLCGRRRCKDQRYARLHPEELAAKQRRKYQRRKAA